MNLLPFKNLPVHTERKFVPRDIDLGDWSRLEPLFDRLEQDVEACKSVADFEEWILRWGELAAALDEEASKRYIAMTCHTDNAEAENAYLHFLEQVDPRVKPRQFRLSQLYLEQPLRGQLPGERYRVFDRDIALQVELFREENVALETEESKLAQEYQKLSGSLTVKFHGKEHTLVQMGKYLEETRRDVRQEAWELVARRRLQEKDRFDHLLDRQLAIREKIAANAGFDNYRDYAFKDRGRFDYGPAECEAFHAAIEKEVVPALKELQARRKERLGVDVLRPWDLSVDPEGRPPLKPFETVDQMVAGTQRIFDHLDGELAGYFRTLRELKLLDLDNRKGKAPGGYQCSLEESRLPFIFMNAVGLQRDVETLLHEAGHAFHAMATRAEDLKHYRHAPIEFCEVASMAMELLGGEFIEEFYAGEEAARARRTHLEGIIGVFPWIATVDAFQHWLYTHPGHSRGERRKAWLDLMDRFGGDADWSGYEDARAHLWHRQLHIYIHPFYYIEYGIAQLGALQVWANSKADQAKALGDYKSALTLGGSRPLPDLFTAAGCHFKFDEATVHPLVGMLEAELERLP